MINDLVISQIRQRLEILYQMVDELETGGGGGGGGTTNYNDLSNKPSIEGTQLVGNKSASDLGLATTSQLNRKVDKVEGSTLMTSAQASKLEGIEAGAEVNVQADWNQDNSSADDYIKNKPTIPDLNDYYTKSQTTTQINNGITSAFSPSTITLAEGGTFPSASRDLLTAHKPINVNDDQYYFLEESGVDYLYGSMPTSGAYPSLSYLRIMKSTFAVEFHNTGIDTVPTDDSTNLITSGAVYDAIQGGGGGGTDLTPTYVGAKAATFPEQYMSVLAKHLPFTTSQGLPAQDFSPWSFYAETSSQYYYIAVRTNSNTGPLLYKIAEISKSNRNWTEGGASVLVDDRNKSEVFRPTALSNSQDLNSISRGYYYTLNAANIQNSPTTDPFIIKYIDSANSRGEQTLITTVQSNPKFYFRGRDNTGWSSWYEITGTVVS